MRPKASPLWGARKTAGQRRTGPTGCAIHLWTRPGAARPGKTRLVPELPEVETVARGLGLSLAGRTITGVTIRWQGAIARPTPAHLSERVAGQRVLGVGRRGKYVVVTLDQCYLLIHLMMSGRLLMTDVDEPLDRHVHVVFTLDDGQQLRFRDVRKFGRVYLVDQPEEVTRGLGPEPLAGGFSLDEFRGLLTRRRGRLKSLLLDQRFLAGLGNIYADEALFAARLHPLRAADSLTGIEQARLYGAIRAVLRRAIAGRGTTLGDRGYTDAKGEAGTYQDQIAVYGRSGEPCPRCKTPIERIIVGARSTHYCPRCQLDQA